MGALSVAIRLAKAGCDVNVWEKSSFPGGKLCEFYMSNYRFDKGPSLLTMPELIDELTDISAYPNRLQYHRLDTITNYFYEDGTRFSAEADIEKFSQTMARHLGEDANAVKNHLKDASTFYHFTADIFLFHSISRLKYLWRKSVLKGLVNSWKLPFLKSMHKANSHRFRNPKTTQLFDRYATYNGSNPYKASALLNMIPHLEFGKGAFIPNEGMYDISKHLYECAKYLGVRFNFNATVNQILLEGSKVKGLMVNGTELMSDIVVSNTDMHYLYHQLLPAKYIPHKLLNQEKSSSAFIFYWAVNREFPELHVHNILFSNNYEAEFQSLFSSDEPYFDPTIYINITSKVCKNDAPSGCENWFVMVNVPHNSSQQPIMYAERLRKLVIDKINRMLATQIEQYIVQEESLDPYKIEQNTSSYGGSLYGNSSNNMFAAFLRHANYSSEIKGLYLTGGSVHPGGGIPLSLLSGKIAADLIRDDYNL